MKRGEAIIEKIEQEMDRIFVQYEKTVKTAYTDGKFHNLLLSLQDLKVNYETMENDLFYTVETKENELGENILNLLDQELSRSIDEANKPGANVNLAKRITNLQIAINNVKQAYEEAHHYKPQETFESEM